jgi:hypothetical protein
MWIEIRKAPNLMMAEMWKELFEAEGIPTRILSDGLEEGELSSYRVLVPHFREHVVEEVMRKI